MVFYISTKKKKKWCFTFISSLRPICFHEIEFLKILRNLLLEVTKIEIVMVKIKINKYEIIFFSGENKLREDRK